MKYSLIADAYEKIELTTKRLEMTDLLVELLRQTPKELVDKVVYLTQGKLYPDFMGIEIGMAERMAIDSITMAMGVDKEKVVENYKKSGDLGLTAEKLKEKQASKEPLTVGEVYDVFDKIAHTTGKGSVEIKETLLANLIKRATPKEAKYLIRTVTGRLRLGIGDMTILDALAIAYTGDKRNREKLERAYNLSSDIGDVAKTLATGGIEAIKQFKITFGKPIKPQMAERLASLDEILEKLGGKCAAQYKYDGLRIQSQISSDKIQLFSRRQEDITDQFPDVAEALRKAVIAKEAILDGEAVPVDPNTGELMPFQVISRRRGRKYGIKKMTEEVPVVLCLFDVLYVDGEDLTLQPYPERRKKLAEIIQETDKIKIAEDIISDNPKEIELFFDKAVQEGTEGLICKSIGSDSVYEAGKRGWQWIKWKRSYRSEMADTVDLVVVGAFAGRGRRAGTYGALLMAAYNQEEDRFDTVCKLGSGFTDQDLVQLPEMLKPYLIPHCHPRVNALLKADFWFVPAKVLEVIGDEITLSPVHTCAFGAIRENSGLAIRFPRLVKFRDDRAAEDATKVSEIAEMYKIQLKKISK